MHKYNYYVKNGHVTLFCFIRKRHENKKFLLHFIYIRKIMKIK